VGRSSACSSASRASQLCPDTGAESGVLEGASSSVRAGWSSPTVGEPWRCIGPLEAGCRCSVIFLIIASFCREFSTTVCDELPAINVQVLLNLCFYCCSVPAVRCFGSLDGGDPESTAGRLERRAKRGDIVVKSCCSGISDQPYGERCEEEG
jgi:hypothetical protein